MSKSAILLNTDTSLHKLCFHLQVVNLELLFTMLRTCLNQKNLYTDMQYPALPLTTQKRAKHSKISAHS